ncbi:MAG: vanadium-dependent haloperoxidase [Acetobacteraceae bacterium]|nr:vanadium-dependent haloperoxidase [Acetobacteraceae bacterium]
MRIPPLPVSRAKWVSPELKSFAVPFLLAVALVGAMPTAARPASIVTEWLDEILPAAKEVAWEPTVGARFFAITERAVYETWAAYDPTAVGPVYGAALKNQGGAANEANEREAISDAIYTVLSKIAPQRRRALDERMVELGYDPNSASKPAELGRRAARAVLATFHDDGANESGDFADTTGYTPRRPEITDAWQPIELVGKRQLPMTPQWSRVMPFALTRADQFRPVPPPIPGSAEWARQIDVLIRTSGSLTDAEKAATEFWTEWGSSPAPHLMELTKYISDVNDLRLDDDVKLFWLVSNTLLDVSIATWDAKYAYDYIRPITAIHRLGNQAITAWKPRSFPAALAYSTPGLINAANAQASVPAGIGQEPAADWEPYLPTPAFPSYVSGHSAFCGAWARVMTLFTGKPDLNFRTSVHHLYVELRDLAPPVQLDYPTFEDAAAACSISRIWAGVHWPADIKYGRELGLKVSEIDWQRYQQFVEGFASPANAAFMTLHPPYWMHESDGGARFDAGAGLAIDLAPGDSGTWQSMMLDPLPAGNYELRLKLAVAGEGAVRLDVAVRPLGAQAEPMGDRTLLVPAGGPGKIITVPWTTDGTQTFRVAITARAENGGAKVLVSGMSARRIWPNLGGSPRYYEPSLIGHYN